MRAVVDANVWLAAAIRPSGFARRVQDRAAAGTFSPVTCDATLTELKDVFSRLSRRYALNLRDLNSLVGLLTVDGVFLPDPEVQPVCRDPKDDVYVALAIAAAADYLVTVTLICALTRLSRVTYPPEVSR